MSGGKAFTAGSLGELKDVYSSIAKSVGYVKVDQEVTEQYAGYALGFARSGRPGGHLSRCPLAVAAEPAGPVRPGWAVT